MSVIATYPPNVVLHNPPSPPSPSICSSNNKKRKRSTSLRVRFCLEQTRIAYTYSQSDYDRSGLFPVVDTEKVVLTVSVVASPIQQGTPTTPVTDNKPIKKLQRPPRLTIDTTNIEGPLFFTSLTTNHQKQKPHGDEEEDEHQDAQTIENTKRNRRVE